MQPTWHDEYSQSSVQELEDDELISSIAVIVCIILLLGVVVALASFTRLVGV